MLHVPGVRLQTALVIVLFVGSLSALLASGVHALSLPRRKAEVRGQLREASRRMATATATALPGPLPRNPGPVPKASTAGCATISRRILVDYPGVEGGFYFAASDRFGGFAHPSGKPGPPRPLRATSRLLWIPPLSVDRHSRASASNRASVPSAFRTLAPVGSPF